MIYWGGNMSGEYNNFKIALYNLRKVVLEELKFLSEVCITSAFNLFTRG